MTFFFAAFAILKFRRSGEERLVVAISKPWKPVEDPKSHCPISLLCVSYNIIKRFINARFEPVIDFLLAQGQAGFQRGKSTVYQVILLSQNISDAFDAKKYAGVVFVNLTAAYNTNLAPGPHLEVTEISIEQAEGSYENGSCSEQKLTLPTANSRPRK